MKWPSIRELSEALRDVNANVEGECDVRLQVYEDGQWRLRWGDASYDIDHSGFWGASGVPGVVGGKVQRFNARDVARDLIEQAKDHEASR